MSTKQKTGDTPRVDTEPMLQKDINCYPVSFWSGVYEQIKEEAVSAGVSVESYVTEIIEGEHDYGLIRIADHRTGFRIIIVPQDHFLADSWFKIKEKTVGNNESDD